MLFFIGEGNGWKKEVTRACEATKRGEPNTLEVWFSWWKGHNVAWVCRMIWFTFLFVSILSFCKHAYTSSFFLFLFTPSHVTSQPPKIAFKQHKTAPKITTKTVLNCTKNNTQIVPKIATKAASNSTQTTLKIATKTAPNNTRNNPKLRQKQHLNSTQTTPKQHPNNTKKQYPNNTQTAPKQHQKQHPNSTKNSDQKQPKLHWKQPPKTAQTALKTATKQPWNNHQNGTKKTVVDATAADIAAAGPLPPPPNPLPSGVATMVSLPSLSHAKNTPNPNWVLVSGLLLAPHELGPTPTNFSDSKTTLNFFFLFSKKYKKNFGSLILGYFLVFVFLLLRSIFHIYSCFTKKNVFYFNKFSINFLIDHSRHTRINSENFNFVWNIKGPYASSNIQMKFNFQKC